MSYTEEEYREYEREQQYQTEQEIERLAQDTASQVYDAAFGILDSIGAIDGAVAGNIAKAVQDTVERELKHVL